MTTRTTGFSEPIENFPIFRRVVQLTCDLAGGSVAGLRILDLACAHGEYAIEFAKRGATVVGIEGREEWLKIARRNGTLPNVEFVQDDVRNLSVEKYGEFDIVLCLGILYHLDAPDVFEFATRVAAVCKRFAIVETHFATQIETAHEWGGRRYFGLSAGEHAPDATREQRLQALGASLDNDSSFWMTQASICNLLRHVGFTSVSDCRNPVAYLLVGAEKRFRMWGNRVTLAAFKGEPVTLSVIPYATPEREVDWPEDIEPYRFENEFAKRGEGWANVEILRDELARAHQQLHHAQEENQRHRLVLRTRIVSAALAVQQWLARLRGR